MSDDARTGAYIVGGLAIGAVLIAAYSYLKGAGGQGGAAAGLGRAVVGAADGLISGAVKGVGAIVGVPDTNLSDCERAKAEGRTWDASFACPAADFISYVFKPAPAAEKDLLSRPAPDARNIPCMCIVAPCGCDGASALGTLTPFMVGA